MAYAGTQQHTKRLTRIEAKRRAISKGAVYSVNQDGLIIARPRRRGMQLPLRGVFFAFASVILFKVVLLASLGAGTYNSRVAELASGSVFERAGAWAMTADPLTLWTATQVKLLLT
jgi:hypothetical protein